MDSEVCLFCSEEIQENDKKMQMHCCNAVLHTKCGFTHINQHLNHIWHLNCFCGQPLFTLDNIENQDEQNNYAQLDTNEVLQTEIKNLKKKVREANKFKTAYSKKISEKQAQFKTATAEKVQELKQIKEHYLAEVKNMEELRQFISKKRIVKTKQNKLAKEFNLDRIYIREKIYGNWNTYSEFNWRNPHSHLKYHTFRIVI